MYNSGSEHIVKYGASYYIDGGDEGTSQIYSASTDIKKITGIGTEALMGIAPNDYIFNSLGTNLDFQYWYNQDAVTNLPISNTTPINAISNAAALKIAMSPMIE